MHSIGSWGTTTQLLNNACIMTRPRHPLIRNLIDRIVETPEPKCPNLWPRYKKIQKAIFSTFQLFFFFLDPFWYLE